MEGGQQPSTSTSRPAEGDALRPERAGGPSRKERVPLVRWMNQSELRRTRGGFLLRFGGAGPLRLRAGGRVCVITEPVESALIPSCRPSSSFPSHVFHSACCLHLLEPPSAPLPDSAPFTCHRVGLHSSSLCSSPRSSEVTPESGGSGLTHEAEKNPEVSGGEQQSH